MRFTMPRIRRAPAGAPGASERLSNAEVHAPAARLRLAVDDQSLDGVELVPQVHANRTDGRAIAEPRPRRHAEVAELELPGTLPHVSCVEECDDAQFARRVRPQFGAPLQHAESAERLSRIAERAHLEAAPAAQARGA